MDLSRLRGQEGCLRYILAVPKARISTGYPVLFFLHGYDEGMPTDIQDALTRHGPLRPGNAVPALQHFIIIAPQMPTRGDVWHRYTKAVRLILRHVHQRYGGDPKRTYLTGFSFGANGVFDLALLQPATWAGYGRLTPPAYLYEIRSAPSGSPSAKCPDTKRTATSAHSIYGPSRRPLMQIASTSISVQTTSALPRWRTGTSEYTYGCSPSASAR